MRILRIAQKVYPDAKGGGPYHVHALSRDQAAMGHDVTVLTVRLDPDLPRVEERDGYTVIRYDPAAEPLGNHISPGLAQHLSTVDGFDVMHAHSHLYFATNAAAVKRRFGDVPLAITNHGLYSQSAPKSVFDLYLKSLGRWTFNRADVVFCYTPADCRRVASFGVDAPIEVVPNGIDTERFTPTGPESDRVPSDDFVVLFVGRLVEGKQPMDAIAAFERIRSEYPDARLYVCGDGPLRDELEAEACDGVSFLGHLSYDEMPPVYRSADVLVLPSRAEGLPRTVLEAMATEVPVVVNDLEHIESIVRKGGVSIRTDRTDAFAGVLERLAENESERTRLGARGRAEIERRYRWADTVDATTRALRAVADGH